MDAVNLHTEVSSGFVLWHRTGCKDVTSDSAVAWKARCEQTKEQLQPGVKLDNGGMSLKDCTEKCNLPPLHKKISLWREHFCDQFQDSTFHFCPDDQRQSSSNLFTHSNTSSAHCVLIQCFGTAISMNSCLFDLSSWPWGHSFDSLARKWFVYCPWYCGAHQG